MEHRQVVVDMVTARSAAEGTNIVLHLASDRELIIRRDDPHMQVWRRAIAFQQGKHLPLYIEFDPESRVITKLLLCERRKIEAVQPQASGDVTIRIFMSPSFYKLKRSQANFAAILPALTRAVETGLEILIAEDPAGQEIVYAEDLKGQ